MKKKPLTDQEILFINQSLQKQDFEALSKWVQEDDFKAKEVFSFYQSMSGLEMANRILTPSSFTQIKKKTEDFISLVIKKIDSSLNNLNNLEWVIGQEHEYIPKAGWTRNAEEDSSVSKVGVNIIHLLAFSIQAEDENYKIFFKKFSDLQINHGEEIIYRGRNLPELELTLKKGIYNIKVDEKLWKLEVL